jgi:immune inhibitor A
VRKILLGVVLGALLTLTVAVPALATTGRSAMPPSDVLLVKALKARGIIPRAATAAQQQSILKAYLRDKLGGKPEDRPLTNRTYDGITLRGRTAWGRAVALDPSVTVDNALVILVQFDPNEYVPSSGPFAGETFQGGPLHGQIPAPASGDNTTFWPGPGNKGFGTSHYQRMLFGDSFPIYDKAGKLRGTSTQTMQDYYLEMSKGAYKVTGQIHDWVTVPYPESWYGRDSVNTDDYTGPVWRVVEDAVDALKAANPTFNWARYDQKNPFGIAGQDPDVPDGYVDHLILVHAGVDQSAGGGAQGDDSIWAHSSWVDSANGQGPLSFGGYQVDSATSAARPGGIWIGPYTINPEDGGIGVFCHEFGHDLGLPDEYDTTYAGESPSGFWTLMSSGSWLGKKWGLDTRPAPMNAWDKAALGFITPKVVGLGAHTKVTLKPAATGGTGNTAIKVQLPDAYHFTELSGSSDTHNPEFWSGQGNDLNNSWVIWNDSPAPGSAYQFTVPDAGGDLTFNAWYEMENGYDYGFVEASADDGSSWTALAGNHTVDAGSGNPGINGASGGGVAGTDDPAWEAETYSLDAYAGEAIQLRFHYLTDPAVSYRGWEVTDVSVANSPTDVSFTGADTGYLDPDTAWQQVNGGIGETSSRYYIAEYRNRSGYDGALAACYNFRTNTAADYFPYNTGLHLIYRDTFWADNNVGQHYGEGGWMVVDAHPVPDMQALDIPWRTRIQVRDAAFSTKSTPGMWITPWSGTPEKLWLPGRPAQAVFDDSRIWWFPWAPDSGVKLDELGVRIAVKSMDSKGMVLNVRGATNLPL